MRIGLIDVDRRVKVLPESVEIIVKEHSDKYTPNGEFIPDCCATVGWKCLYDGQFYGSFIIIEKPTLTGAEVVEATNLLLEQMIDTLEVLDNGRTQDVRKNNNRQ